MGLGGGYSEGSGETMSEMTGLERLRALGREQEERSWSTVGKVRGRLMLQIAEQIEDERLREQLAVERVASEMELHCLGVEGMEDSPVARWARELREALDGDALTDEDLAAAAWVREHGGLYHVKDIYNDLRAVVERIGIEWSESELHGLMDALDRRLMPEGMGWLVEAWPRFEDGEPLRVGDEVCGGGRAFIVDHVVLFSNGESTVCAEADMDSGKVRDYARVRPSYRLKRPAPKVLDADGAEIREKCDVWWICEGDERGVHAERLRVETIGPNGLIECSPYNGGTWVYLEPSELYVNEPVIAADGKPLREGQTVWHVKTGREYVVVEPSYGKTVVVRLAKYDDVEGEQHAPDQLTHQRPDSWERLEEDAEGIRRDIAMYLGDYSQSDFEEPGDSVQSRVVDLVRRCRALAERKRGE